MEIALVIYAMAMFYSYNNDELIFWESIGQNREGHGIVWMVIGLLAMPLLKVLFYLKRGDFLLEERKTRGN